MLEAERQAEAFRTGARQGRLCCLGRLVRFGTREPGRDHRRERHRRHDPEAPDEGPHDLDRDGLAVQEQRRRLVANDQEHEQRQARTGIGKEQRVDSRGDVRSADVERARVQPSPTQSVAGELLDGDGLGHGDVVEHADRPDHERREEHAPQVEPLPVRQLERHQLRPERVREAGHARRDRREQGSQREGGRRPEDRRDARPGRPLREADREDCQERRDDDRGRDRRDADHEQRDQDLQDDRHRQGERQQRPNATPAANDDDSGDEQCEQTEELWQPPAIADRDERLPTWVQRVGHDHVLADAIGIAVLLAARPLEVRLDLSARVGAFEQEHPRIGQEAATGTGRVDPMRVEQGRDSTVIGLDDLRSGHRRCQVRKEDDDEQDRRGNGRQDYRGRRRAEPRLKGPHRRRLPRPRSLIPRRRIGARLALHRPSPTRGTPIRHADP